MENYIDLVLWCVLIYATARFLLAYVQLSASTKALEQELREKLDKIIRYVKTERHGDIDYWFDGENDQFIAQGKTREEIVSVLKSRFPRHIFLLENKKILVGPDFAEIDPGDKIDVSKFMESK